MNYLTDFVRACGILCCDNCSAKRLVLHSGSGGSSSNSNSPSPRFPLVNALIRGTSSASTQSASVPDGERVCDGCYNHLVNDAFLRYQQLQQDRKENERLLELERKKAQLLQDQQQAAAAAAAAPSTLSLAKSSLFGNSGKTKDGSAVEGSKATSALQSSLAEIQQALTERGEKLAITVERSEQLREAASDYNRMTRLLLEKQKAKANMWSSMMY